MRQAGQMAVLYSSLPQALTKLLAAIYHEGEFDAV